MLLAVSFSCYFVSRRPPFSPCKMGCYACHEGVPGTACGALTLLRLELLSPPPGQCSRFTFGGRRPSWASEVINDRERAGPRSKVFSSGWLAFLMFVSLFEMCSPPGRVLQRALRWSLPSLCQCERTRQTGLTLTANQWVLGE